MKRKNVSEYWKNVYGTDPPMMEWQFGAVSVQPLRAPELVEMRNENPATPGFWTDWKHYFGEEESFRDMNVGNECSQERCVVLLAERMVLENVIWDHLNVWDSIYKLRADKMEIDQCVIQKDDLYWYCIRPVFYGLETAKPPHLGPGWRPVRHFWGMPGIFIENESQIACRLYIAAEACASLEDAQACLSKPEILDLSCVCDEIFGDG